MAGQLDMRTVNDAWRRISSAIATSGRPELVVDVSGVTYCDGAGLGLFAQLRRLVAVAGGHVQFTGSSPELGRLVGIILAYQCAPPMRR